MSNNQVTTHNEKQSEKKVVQQKDPEHLRRSFNRQMRDIGRITSKMKPSFRDGIAQQAQQVPNDMSSIFEMTYID